MPDWPVVHGVTVKVLATLKPGSLNSGVLVNSVDYMGFRVVAYAMMPDWPVVHGVLDGEWKKGDKDADEIISSIEEALNLKPTRVKLVSKEEGSFHLSPSLHLRRDEDGTFCLCRPRERILPPLASAESEVEYENDRCLRPELLRRLPNPLSPIPSPDFSDDVTFVEQSSKLKREIVDAYAYLTNEVIPSFVKQLDALHKIPTHVQSLRTCFHEEGINMAFLGLVHRTSRLHYVHALCVGVPPTPLKL